jgi:selenide, water dikinase
LLVGADTLDDAGVYQLSPDLALVLTTDFFPPLVDDPYDFGRIAAANALSDVYAMGGEPLVALNLVGFPDKELDLSVLVEILRGGSDVVTAAGACIAGGHSVRDAEVKYGLAVTGRVPPQRILTNANAQPGDQLVLTKPIGSGVLTTAVKRGLLPPDELREAVTVMTTLNKAGRDAAVKVGVSACTDITGFGLIGHAGEMAAGGRVTIVLHAGQVPLMNHTLDLARQGVITRMAGGGRTFLGEQLVIEPGVEEALASVLADAQTSGGLLISVPAARCAALVAELQAQGTLTAAVVGRVEPASDVRVRVGS